MERDDVAPQRKVYQPLAGLLASGEFFRLWRTKIPTPVQATGYSGIFATGAYGL
jgi:hypothetical protein